MSGQLGLLSWQPPVAAPKAADGVKRAARAGSRVDAAVLAVCAENVGREMREREFWACVDARAKCEPDTARRRRDALRDEGLLAYRRPATGVVLIEWCREAP